MYDNPLVYGKSQISKIVSCHPVYRDKATMRYYVREGNNVIHEDVEWYPYAWVENLSVVAGLKNVQTYRLKGDLHFKYLVYTDTHDDFKKLKGRVRLANEEKEHSGYVIGNASHAWLVSTGNTLFKGMEFNDPIRGALDIETYGKNHFARAENPDDPIIVITLADNRDRKAILHTHPTFRCDDDIWFSTEKEMLQGMVDIINDWDLDIIEWHNGFNYDGPYISTRADYNDVKLKIGRDGSEPWRYKSSFRAGENNKDYTVFSVKGRHCVDTMFSAMTYDVFKRELPSYGLKPIAKYFGFQKENRTMVTGDRIWWHWDNDPKPLLEYAIEDSIETAAISEELNGAPFYATQIIPMAYEEVCRRGSGSKVEFLFLREYLRQRHSIPKPQKGIMKAGGHTAIHLQGVVGPVVHADVESLYPSIMLNFPGCTPKSDELGIFKELLKALTDLRFESKGKMKRARKPEMRRRWEAKQAAEKVLINCFDEETEVLTKDGIKYISEIKVGDMVYSIDPDTNIISEKPVTKTMKQEYHGDMVSIKSCYIDFLVTPNHKMLVSNDGENYDFVNASDLKGVGRLYLPAINEIPIQESKQYMSILEHPYDFDLDIVGDKVRPSQTGPGRKGKLQPYTYLTRNLLALMGWFISEGTTYVSKPKKFPNGNMRGVSHKIVICQKNERYIGEIKHLLDFMGISYGLDQNGIWFCSRVLHKWLTDQCGSGSFNKRIPEWVFKLSPRLQHSLLDSLMKGDGDQRYNRYTTASDQLSQDFIRLCNHLGIRCGRRQKEGTSHRIGFSRDRGTKPVIKRDKHVSLIDYNGMIYCVEVKDNHTVLAGRNGRLNWTGQSFYGYEGFNHALWNDFVAADMVTSTGRDTIKSMAEYVKNHGGVVIEVDTDGIYFIPPGYMNSTTEETPGTTTEEEERAFVSSMSDIMPEGIKIGFDGRYQQIMSYKSKNYILETYPTEEDIKNGKHYGERIRKGSSFRSRSIEGFGKQFINEGFDAVMDGGITRLAELYGEFREKIINHDLTVDDISKTTSLGKNIPQYLEDLSKPRVYRSAQYEVAIKMIEEIGLDLGKGDKVSYYISGNGDDLKFKKRYQLAKHVDKYEKGDANVAHYLARLDKISEKFLPLFNGEDFRDIFMQQPSLFDVDISTIKPITKHIK